MNFQSDSTVLTISQDHYIGVGRDRECYLHPSYPQVCIKVSKSSKKQSRREVAYYQFLLKSKVSFSHISEYFGSIKTSKGIGECFEVIRDYDQSISKTLRECVREQKKTKKQLQPLLNGLHIYLVKNNISVRDLSPANIMLKRISECEETLVIIDGLGNPNGNPLTIRIKFLTQKAISKSWQSLERKLTSEYENHFKLGLTE